MKKRLLRFLTPMLWFLLLVVTGYAQTQQPSQYDILMHWAPIFYQDVNKGNYALLRQFYEARDIPVAIEFDGDYDTRNNWDNSHYQVSEQGKDLSDHRATPFLYPCVYTGFVETDKFYFLSYISYYAGNDHFTPNSSSAKKAKHQNDFEGVFMVIRKSSDVFGTFEGIMTRAHSAQQMPSNDAVRFGSASNPLLSGSHPKIYSSSQGILRQGNYAGHGKYVFGLVQESRGSDGIMLLPDDFSENITNTNIPGKNNSWDDAPKYKYKLIPLEELWNHRGDEKVHDWNHYALFAGKRGGYPLGGDLPWRDDYFIDPLNYEQFKNRISGLELETYTYNPYYLNQSGNAGQARKNIPSTDYSGVSNPTEKIAPLPSEWTLNDFGGAKGKVYFRQNTFTLHGKSSLLVNTSGPYSFVKQSLAPGGNSITARITNIQNIAGDFTKAGLMIRSGSEYVFLCATPSGKINLIAAKASGLNVLASLSTGFPLKRSVYLKLEEWNGNFTAKYSIDGNNWTTLGTGTISISTPLKDYGLAITSGNPSEYASASFDNVAIGGNQGNSTSVVWYDLDYRLSALGQIRQGDGTYVVTTAYEGNINYVTSALDRHGRRDGAYQFYGSSSYISVPTFPKLLGNKFSVSVWIKPSNFDPGRREIISVGQSSAKNGLFLFMDGNKLETDVSGVQGPSIQLRNSWPIDAWINLIVTYDNSDLKIYFNGQALGIRNINGVDIKQGPLNIGKNFLPGWNTPWVGSIDELRIFDYALTDGEIASLAGDWTAPRKIAQYDFNGNANEVTGTGMNGVVQGATLTSGRFRENNTAYYFDGTDDHIAVGNFAALGSRFSIAAWVMADADAGTSRREILSAERPLTNEGVYLHKMSKLRTDLSNVAGPESLSDFPLRKWCHVVVTAEGDKMKLYVDGVLANTKAMSPGVTAGLLSFGKFSNTSFWKGRIDDVSFYNYPLALNEIISLSNDRPTDIVAYYPFNGNAKDESGGILDGVVTGAQPAQDNFNIPGSAYSFNGTSNVAIPDFPALGAKHSCALWLRPGQMTNGQSILELGQVVSGSPSNGGLKISTTATGLKLSYFVQSTVKEVTFSVPLSSPLPWTHLALTHDGSNLLVYVNGIQVNSGQFQSSILAGTLRIGSSLIGDLDEVRLSSVAWSSSEVSAHFNAKPFISAGIDQTVCGPTTNLEGIIPANASGKWTVTNGVAGGSFDSDANPTATFTGTPGSTYKLQWALQKSEQIVVDEVTITLDKDVTANAGADTVIVGNPTQSGDLGVKFLSATPPEIGTGLWDFANNDPRATEALADPSHPGGSFSADYGRSYDLAWTVKNGACSSSDTVKVTFLPHMHGVRFSFDGSFLDYLKNQLGTNGNNALTLDPGNPQIDHYLTSYTSSPNTGSVKRTVDRFGTVDEAIQLDGTYYMRTATNLPALGSNYTLSVWIRANSQVVTNQMTLLEGGDGTPGGSFRLTAGPQGVTPDIFSVKHIIDTDTVSTTNAITYGYWYHVVATISSGAFTTLVTIYVNGVRQQSRQFLRQKQGVSKWIMSGLLKVGNPWNGDIDDVVVLPRVLDEDEVLDFYENTKCTGCNFSGVRFTFDNPTPHTGQSGNADYRWNQIGSDGDNAFTREGGIATNDNTCSASSSTPRLIDRFGDSNKAIDGSGTATTAFPLPPLGNDFTLAAWVKPTGTNSNWSADRTLFYLGGTTTYKNTFYLGAKRKTTVASDNTLELRTYLNQSLTNVSCNINLDQWVHIVVTVNGRTQKMFVNGTLMSNGILSSAPDLPFGYLLMGCGGFGQSASNWKGTLDDMMVLPKAISEAEVTTLYNNTKPSTSARKIAEDVADEGTPESSGIIISPNPASNELNVQFTLQKDGPVAISLQDLTGRTVLKINRELKAGRQTVELKNLSESVQKGMYLIRINAADIHETRKVVFD